VQNPENRRQILADNKLEVVFGKKEGHQMNGADPRGRRRRPIRETVRCCDLLVAAKLPWPALVSAPTPAIRLG
jgi:hypothetical protein